MIYLIVIAFVIVITAFYGNLNKGNLDFGAAEAAVMAQQMVYYHSAAAKTCASTCVGPIDPSDELTTSKQGLGAFSDGTFVSIATADYIVTYYVHRLSAGTRDEYEARIAMAVPDFMERDTSFWAGPYDADTGQVEFGGGTLWRDPETGVTTPTVPEVIQLSIPAIADGAPVIANRK